MIPLLLAILWELSGCSALFLDDTTDTLDAGLALKPFEDCFVQIVKLRIAYILPKNESTKIFSSYDLAPMNIPIQLDQIEETLEENSDDWNRDELQELLYEALAEVNRSLSDSKNRKYKVRNGCSVRVYVNLPSCDDWPTSSSLVTHQVCTASGEMMQYDSEPVKNIRSGDNGQFYGRNILYRDGFFLIHIVGNPLNQVSLNSLKEIEVSGVFQFPPILIMFHPGPKNVITAAKILMCPNTKQYVAMVKQYCYLFMRSWFLRPLYNICAKQFSHFLAIEEDISIEDFKTWHHISRFAYAPCERAHMLYANSRLDLGRKGENWKHEYLLDWTKEMGTLAYLYPRLMFQNITYLNEDEEGDVETGNEGHFYTVYRNLNRIHLLEVIFPGATDEIFFSNQFYDQVHFVMCYGVTVKSGLSFSGFVSAFKFDVWITLVLLLFGGCGIIHLSGLLFPLPNMHYRPLQVYNILLAQNASHLRENRWFYGAWVLGGLVLTNHYLGDNINELTAPLLESKLDTFEQIFENKLKVISRVYYNHASHNYLEVYENLLEVDRIRIALGNFFYNDLYEIVDVNEKRYRRTQNNTIFSLFHKFHNYNLSEEAQNKKLNEILISYKQLFDSPDRHELFYEAMSKCSKKAYVDVKSEVLNMKRLLIKGIRNKSIDVDESAVVISKAKYGQVYYNLVIAGLRGSPQVALRKFFLLSQSGIDVLWQNWKNRIDSWNETIELEKTNEKHVFQPAKLHGNIRVVFFLHLLLLGCANFIIVFEWWKGYDISIRVIALKVWALLKRVPEFWKRSYRIVWQWSKNYQLKSLPICSKHCPNYLRKECRH